MKTMIVALLSGIVAALMLPASAANAETGVWHQAFERPSADAPCEAPEDETPWQESFSGQREWTPSWAQWPNDGQGGWVCQRSIVWANVPAYPSAGCILAFSYFLGDLYANFGGGFYVPPNYALLNDSNCSNVSGTRFTVPIVYAPAGFDPDTLCREVSGTSVSTTSSTGVADTYFCN